MLALTILLLVGCSSKTESSIDIEPTINNDIPVETTSTQFLTDEELSEILKENAQINATYDELSEGNLNLSSCNKFNDLEMKSTCLDTYYFNLASEQSNIQFCQNITAILNKERCIQELSSL